ncbi:MAG: glycerate-2-kinase family protein, partial [Chloroflexi bacterium]|nr:glycerate-2-kinase family protein [Chloroflexota bacterium]
MTPDLRAVAAQLQQAALRAVDPAEAVYKAMSRVGDQLLVDSRAYDLRHFEQVFVGGAGKAAVPMADAACEVLHDRLSGGVIVTKYGHVDRALPDQIRVREAGHPVPDQNSIDATRELAALLKSATPRDLVIAVISGGGSALMTLPAGDVSLADLQATTHLLLRAGATIHQINSIRKHLDDIKGGGLARLANGATIITLVLSDVIGDDLSV